jgi:hypothetical protein
MKTSRGARGAVVVLGALAAACSGVSSHAEREAGRTDDALTSINDVEEFSKVQLLGDKNLVGTLRWPGVYPSHLAITAKDRVTGAKVTDTFAYTFTLGKAAHYYGSIAGICERPAHVTASGAPCRSYAMKVEACEPRPPPPLPLEPGGPLAPAASIPMPDDDSDAGRIQPAQGSRGVRDC